MSRQAARIAASVGLPAQMSHPIFTTHKNARMEPAHALHATGTEAQFPLDMPEAAEEDIGTARNVV